MKTKADSVRQAAFLGVLRVPAGDLEIPDYERLRAEALERARVAAAALHRERSAAGSQGRGRGPATHAVAERLEKHRGPDVIIRRKGTTS